MELALRRIHPFTSCGNLKPPEIREHCSQDQCVTCGRLAAFHASALQQCARPLQLFTQRLSYHFGLCIYVYITERSMFSGHHIFQRGTRPCVPGAIATPTWLLLEGPASSLAPWMQLPNSSWRVLLSGCLPKFGLQPELNATSNCQNHFL